MGDVNTMYVPAAILHDNPGITREEFMTLLNEVRVGLPTSVDREWGDCGPPEKEKSEFHLGIFGLADILGLWRDINWFEFKGPNASRSRFIEGQEELFVVPVRGERGWLAPHYIVSTYIRDDHGKTHDGKGFFPRLPKIGEEVSNVGEAYDSDRSVILEVKGSEREGDGLVADLVVQELIPVYETRHFSNVQDLVQFDTDLDPYEHIDWDTKSGHFNAYHFDGVEWRRVGKRYYLDISSDVDEHHFTSMIITAEAVRKKAWNLFGWEGYFHTQRFLVDHPDSMARHRQAVFDYWTNSTSIGMSNFDFLRRRAEMNAGFDSKRGMDDQTALSIVIREGAGSFSGKNGWLIGRQAPRENYVPRVEDKIPF